MKSMKSLIAAGALCVSAVWISACATVPADGSSGPVPAAGPRISADSAAALEAIYRARMEESRGRYTEADVRFMTDMIGHHAQAVLMANMAETRASHPAVRTLAARIRNGQVGEIALMQKWLTDRGLPAPEPDLVADSPDEHAGHGAHAGHAGRAAPGPDTTHAGMPGMLSPAQLRELAAASGEGFDFLFTSRMIEHHRGAIVMVEALMSADGAAQDPMVFRFASEVQAEQTTEIGRMQRLLATLLGGGTR